MKKQIVVLTGAGISAESGLKTFRDADGLWMGHRVEEVASPAAFDRNPEMVHEFYNQRRRQLLTVDPNPAHCALAKLEAEANDARLILITQNVDDLHERGGSKNVLHMHGELLRKRCRWCETRSSCRVDLGSSDECNNCGRAGGMRPDIVWFGEMPYFMEEIERALEQADLFIAVGTSGVVYPAGGFCDIARQHGSHTIELNKEATAISSSFHETRIGPAAAVVPILVEELLGE